MHSIRVSLGVLVLVACGPGSHPVNAALGGTYDVRLCGPGVSAPAPYLTAKASGASVALAVCGDLASDNTSSVEGDVRVRGSLRVASPVHIDGALMTGGQIDSPNTLDVGGTFSTASDWSVSSPARIHGDATVAGALHHENAVTIDGTLTATSESGSGALEAGHTVIATTWVDTPLSCDRAPNAHAFADDAATNLEAQALDPSSLANVKQPTELTMGCGRYVLTSLETNNTLKIHIVGPTVLVIRGRMHIAAPTTFDVSQGGSLELIVDGALDVDNTLDLGTANVAVAGDVRIGSPTTLIGTLIAPTASLSCDNTLDVVGALYVGNTRVASPLTIRAGQVIGVEGWPTQAL